MTPPASTEPHSLRCETCENWMDPEFVCKILDHQLFQNEYTFIMKVGCASHSAAQQPAPVANDGTEEGDGLLKYIVEVKTKSPITDRQKTIVVRNINLNIWKALDEYLPEGVCCSVYSQEPEHDVTIHQEAERKAREEVLKILERGKSALHQLEIDGYSTQLLVAKQDVLGWVEQEVLRSQLPEQPEDRHP